MSLSISAKKSVSNVVINKAAALISDCWPIFGIIGLYLLCISIISVQGEFPINDDYAYTKALKYFLQTKQLMLQECAASCYLHILIGAAVCSLFGFSFTILRITELFISAFGAIGLYLTIREIGLPRTLSFIFTSVYVLNPWIINLGLTFMTDITQLSLNNWYFYFTIRLLKTGRYSYLIASSLAFLASFLVRQSSIVFLLPNLIVIFALKENRKQFLVAFFALLFIPPAFSFMLMHYMAVSDPLSDLAINAQRWWALHFFNLLIHHPLKGIAQLISATGQLLCYLAVMVSPILLPFYFMRDRGNPMLYRAIWILSSCFIAFAATDLVIVQGRLMPFNGNLFVPPWFCVPPILGRPISPLPHMFFILFTSCSFLLAFSLFFVLALIGWFGLKELVGRQEKSPSSNRYLLPYVFLVAIATISFVVIQIVSRDLDRYYMLSLAPVLLALAAGTIYFAVPKQLVLSLPLICLLGVYSIAANQDCFNAHSAQRAAINFLESKKIDPAKIDGGWQYDLLTNPDLIKKFTIDKDHCGYPHSALGNESLANDRFWAVNGEQYLISFSQKPGYDVLAHFPYWCAVQWKEREILVLKHH